MFLLEWDRGTESLATLVAKLDRYRAFWRSRGYRHWLPGVSLKPRLAIVCRQERAERLVRHLSSAADGLEGTVFVGVGDGVLKCPLGNRWWRSDLAGLGSLVH